jgi:hypothetical protein
MKLNLKFFLLSVMVITSISSCKKDKDQASPSEAPSTGIWTIKERILKDSIWGPDTVSYYENSPTCAIQFFEDNKFTYYSLPQKRFSGTYLKWGSKLIFTFDNGTKDTLIIKVNKSEMKVISDKVDTIYNHIADNVPENPEFRGNWRQANHVVWITDDNNDTTYYSSVSFPGNETTYSFKNNNDLEVNRHGKIYNTFYLDEGEDRVLLGYNSQPSPNFMRYHYTFEDSNHLILFIAYKPYKGEHKYSRITLERY